MCGFFLGRKMIGTCLLLLIGVSVTFGGYHKSDDCYHHFDHAAKYRLCHDNRGYPTSEINLVLNSHPEMKDMFYDDNTPLTAPSRHYTSPPQAVCPYDRYTLYSFFYANKDCYVIYPEVQKITYVQCNANNDYDCQRCASYGGVSKCAEDYDYRHVWAYCLPQHNDLKPVQPRLVPDPVRKVNPQFPQVQEPRYYDTAPTNIEYGKIRLAPPQTEAPQVYYARGGANGEFAVNRAEKPQVSANYKYSRVYRDPWRNKVYRPYLPIHRWKRSYKPVPAKGTIERLKLYLPHHCGCKNYVC